MKIADDLKSYANSLPSTTRIVTRSGVRFCNRNYHSAELRRMLGMYVTAKYDKTIHDVIFVSLENTFLTLIIFEKPAHDALWLQHDFSAELLSRKP